MARVLEISSDENYRVATYGSLMVVFWKQGFTPTACKQLEGMFRVLAAKQRDGRVSILSILLPSVGAPPSSEARQALVTMTLSLSSLIHRVAVVREGQGFIASAIVSILAGVQLLARPQHGYRFFSNLDDAMPWVVDGLADFTSGAFTVTDAIAAVLMEQNGSSIAKPA